MVPPRDVDALLARHLPSLPAEDCPLLSAYGRVLRAPLAADRDLPPYDRVMLDGYALSYQAYTSGRRDFQVEGLQAAGSVRQALRQPNAGCIEIATGAVLPEGCDLIVPYEDVERSGDTVHLLPQVRHHRGAHVHTQGTDARAGQVLLPVGTRLGGKEVAVAAACGAAQVRVSVQPNIAVIATGDELVDVENASPAPHQVRRSNDYALRAALLAQGFTRIERLHLRDHRYELETQLRRLMAEFDCLILSGGVSKGRYDFLPLVLEQLGVEKLVRGVSQRPGKPFWFGVTSRRIPVFALPGNPVAAFTCFHRYALPALRRMRGENLPVPMEVRLAEEFPFGPALTPLVPVVLRMDAEGRLVAHPSPTQTSGDFVGLLGTDGFLELPAGPGPFAPGTPGRFWPWHGRSLAH